MLDYKFYNPNPRGKVVGDCVKRSLVVATEMDYHELEIFMNRNKVKKDEPYNDQRNYEHVIDLLGGKKIKMTPPPGTNRWHVTTIDKVMRKYPHIRYILQVSHHLIGVKDNTIYDLFDDRQRDKGIYKMFVFNASYQEVYRIQEECSRGN